MDFLATWRVIDVITGPARRIQRAAETAQAAMDKAGRAMGGSFNRAGSSVTALRDRIEALRNMRDNLRIGVDISEINRANRELRGLQANLDRMEARNARADGTRIGGGLMGGLRNRLMPMLGISAIVSGIASSMNAGMQREAGQVDYQQFLGKNNGSAVYAQMNKFANDTILNNKDVLEAGAKMSSQFKPSEILSQMKMYGDLTGGDGEKLKRLTTIIGKVKETRVLQGDESEQLNEIGIYGLNAQIAKMKGISLSAFRKMREDGKITFQDVQNAMVAMTSKGGQYFEYLQAKSQTTWGKMQKLIGNVQSQIAEMGKGKLPLLNTILDWVNKFVDNWKPIGEAIGKFGMAFSPILGAIRQLLEAFGLVSPAGDGVMATVSLITNIFNKLANVVFFVGSVVNNLISIVRTLPFGDTILQVLAVVSVFKYFGIIPKILSMVGTAWRLLNVTFMATPIGWIIGGIIALVAALTYAWQNSDKFREVVIRSWEGIKAVWAGVSTWFIDMWNSVSTWVSGAWATVVQFWNSLGATIHEAVAAVKLAFYNLWLRITGVWESIKLFVVQKFLEMYAPVKPYVDMIVQAFDWVRQKVGGIWDWITDKVKSTFGWLIKLIDPVLKLGGKALGFTGDFAKMGLGLSAGLMNAPAIAGAVIGENINKMFQSGFNSKAADDAVKAAKIANDAKKPQSFFEKIMGGNGMANDLMGGGADGSGSGSGAGAGITDTVEGARSRTVNITIKNLVETINNYVNSDQVGNKVSNDAIDFLNRALSSGERLAYE
jgi:tape measure domain-containing protein